MEWKDGKVTSLKVTSRLGGNLRIRVANELDLKNGDLVAAEGENHNPYYLTPDVAAPIIKDIAKLDIQPQTAAVLYDVQTERGKTYNFVSK